MDASITLRKNNHGTTLVEMIATFALVGIFIISAAAVISSAILMQSELTDVMHAQNVGEMLLDKITGELAASRNTDYSLAISRGAEKKNAIGDTVTYRDRNGRSAQLCAEDGMLTIHYDSQSGDQEDENFPDSENDWQMDEKAYMGFRITELTVQQLNTDSVLEVSIRLRNLKTGFEYSATRCTECYG